MASEAVQRFCDLHFDGVNVAASKRAFIDLKLYTLADKQPHSQPAIAQSRSDARATVSNHLSSAGKAELVQALNADLRQSAFAQHLAEADLQYLAGPVWFAHGNDLRDAGALEQAGHIFVNAARAFDFSKQPKWAVDACTAAVSAYELAGLPSEAKGAWAGVGSAWEAVAIDRARRGLNEWAADACRLAVEAYLRADKPGAAATARWREAKYCGQANLPERRALALLAAGEDYIQAGELYNAVNAFSTAAGIFAQLKLPLLASDAYWKQANTEMLLGHYLHAALAYENAAAADTLADKPEQARQARIKAAAAYVMNAKAAPPGKLPLRVHDWARAGDLYSLAGEPGQAAVLFARAASHQSVSYRTREAADLWRLAGTDYSKAGLELEAAVVWRLAAYAYTKLGLVESAEEAFRNAVQAYQLANQPELAQAVAIEAQAAAHHGKGQHTLAATGYTEAAHVYLQMKDFHEAAKALRRAAQSHTLAGGHTLAAQALVEAAECYWQAKMPASAGRSEEEASHEYDAAGLKNEAKAAHERAKAAYTLGAQDG
ncbi:tetratricopeptide repeat protein [Pandoraea sputorum]|nr:hypothetical protein [Pandoraea sputorum]